MAASLAAVVTTILTFFSGTDTAGREAVWKTNGTAAGTIEIAKLYGTSNKPYGSFAQLGAKVAFEGENSHFVNGLFVTDGTTAGTKEIVVAGASRTQGLNPVELTTLGQKVLFNGLDSSSNLDLWLTDGTPAGTKPIAGTINIDPRHLLAFENKVFFASIQRKGLWVSNGTAGGTHQVAGTSALIPEQLTNAGGKLYFVDRPTGYLYTSNGTATGTKKLVYTGRSLDLTAYGKRLFFESYDTNEHLDLFVTDGTAAGTHQVPHTTGIFDNLLDPARGGGPLSPALTLFKGDLYFEAQSSKGGFGLWVTNGTADGTHEIKGIKGTLAAGIFPSPRDPDFNGPNFAISPNGATLVFDGVSPGGRAPDFGQTNLWVTNGTAAGTHELKGIKGGGYASTLGLDPSNMTTLKVTSGSGS